MVISDAGSSAMDGVTARVRRPLPSTTMVTGLTGEVAQAAINRHCSGELPGVQGFSGVSMPAIVSIAGADEPEEMHDTPLELSSDPVTSEKLANKKVNLRFGRIFNRIALARRTKGAAYPTAI